MMREPVAVTQSRQVRVVANTLTKYGFLSSSFDCVDSRRQGNRGFAQSVLFNVDSHSVVSVLQHPRLGAGED
jgi:hypothetical protein